MISRLLLLLAALCLPSLHAQTTAEPRTALVIGCDYEGTGLHLPSPVRDARAIAAKLESLGFTVTLVTNPELEAFDKAANAFGESLKTRRGVGLFYFSGHGAQVDEKNYLIPHKARLSFREDLRTRAYAAQDVVTRMEAAGCRLNLLFLDACRTNELPSSTSKALGKGLASMEAASGMLLSFASARNTEALDSGSGSVYTNALLTHIATPGLSVLDMLTKVNADVKKLTEGRQVPFMESGLDGTFAFAPGGGGPAPVDAAMAAKLAELERKLAAMQKEGSASKEEAEKLKQQLAVMRPNSAVPVPVPAAGKGFTNTLGMKFVPVPGTSVQFCIHETRSKDFAAFIADKNRGYTMTGSGADDWRTYEYKGVPVGRGASERAEDSIHPVASVSWLDAVAFCEWLSKKEGKTYRLPTDREWSVAVGIPQEPAGSPEDLSGGVKDVYPWGGKFVASAISGNYADATAKEKDTGLGYIDGYRDGFATTAPVMSFAANQHGLYDMGGNLWEWVAGCYDGTDLQGKNKTLTSPRALRGGSWYGSGPAYLLSSNRRDGDPGGRLDNFGFRVVVVGSGG